MTSFFYWEGLLLTRVTCLRDSGFLFCCDGTHIRSVLKTATLRRRSEESSLSEIGLLQSDCFGEELRNDVKILFVEIITSEGSLGFFADLF